MVDTKKRNARQSTWQRDNKDRIIVLADKGLKEQIMKAKPTDQTITQFIIDAIRDKLPP